jgi:hypothetical protein
MSAAYDPTKERAVIDGHAVTVLGDTPEKDSSCPAGPVQTT